MTAEPAWHQALAYAVTGRRFEQLGHQKAPDLDQLTAFLRAELGDTLESLVLAEAQPVPADLRAGLGSAQLWAALTELRRRLRAGAGPATVAVERPLSPDERRLMQDVPPHHGS